ncbi:VanZ family protein [Niabella digestorum]|uniref:VanZ family protein n=1 Tax=Niabella digestorum TaxID=3117701 RepID=A0ABU7RDA1_9BACT
MKKILNSHWPPLLWSAIIVTLLCIPGSSEPESSSLFSIPYIDKYIHFILFALFVIFWGRAISNKPKALFRKKLVWITLAGIFLGYILELVQKHFIPYRSYDGWDVVADAAGAILGLLISLKISAQK